MIKMRIQLKTEDGTRIGLGKVQLLEAIAEIGSISGAARSLRMTYRRAWELVDHMSKTFGTPVVETQTGGSGGAVLTDMGRDIVARYRAIETAIQDIAKPHLDALDAVIVNNTKSEDNKDDGQ